ncbi:MAG: HEAT repeat domain-containing protein [Gemmatales bacterium]
MASIVLLLFCCITQAPPQVPSQLPPQGQPPDNGALSLPRAMDAAPLRELLYSRNRPQEQSQAALKLVQSSSAEVAALVTFELTRWDRTDVFQALAAAIRTEQDKRFIQSMFDALAAEQLPIRSAAIETLAAFPVAAVHDGLNKMAQDKAAVTLRRQAAVEALGRLASKSCVVSLFHLLSCDSAPVRQAATNALQEISGQDFGEDLKLWQNWWQSYEGLSEADWQSSRLRFFANRARRLRDELDQAETTLLQLHKELLDKVMQPDLASTLRALSINPYPAVRELAVTRIAEQFSRKDLEQPSKKQYTEILMQLSKDANARVQQRAVVSLERADAPEVYRLLLDLLKDRSYKVRAAAARSLGNYRGKIPLPDTHDSTLRALEQSLHDSSSTVVAQAATSIGALRMPRSSTLLAGLLKHPTEEVRLAASAALEAIANCRVYHAVLAAIDDASPEARLYLVGSLGVIGENDGLPDSDQARLLMKLERVLTQDGDAGVRSKAAAALGKVGGVRVLPLLWQRVQANEDSRVQDNAWKAMVDILHREQSWPLLQQWEKGLATQGSGARRWQLLLEMRDRWARSDTMRSVLEQVTLAQIDAGLSIRKWQAVVPLCLELIRSAEQESLREERLRLLLIACQQAMQEGKGSELPTVLKEVDVYLPAFKELAASFDDIRRRLK